MKVKVKMKRWTHDYDLSVIVYITTTINKSSPTKNTPRTNISSTKTSGSKVITYPGFTLRDHWRIGRSGYLTTLHL